SRLALGAGGGASVGAFTVTRTLAVAEPPGPLAVTWYEVETVGVTGVEPSGATRPTSGAMVKSVAFVELQDSVTESPGLMLVADALIVTVGCAGAGAGAVVGGSAPTCFLHPLATNTSATK
ncbi:MAG: hypothetical protein WA766_13960, partial [Candidatus Acidiferrales bacterium]